MENNEMDLQLSVGDSLQLQYYPCRPNDEERFYVKVIGYVGDRSIITTAPKSNGPALLSNLDQEFAVRLLHGKSVQAFISNILKRSITPYPYMHLNFPNEMATKIVRRSERATMHVVATVQNKEEHKEAMKTKSALITDMSTDGAQVVTPKEIGEVGDKITVQALIKVADIDGAISIPAKINRIVSIKEDEKSFRYGVEFESLNERDKLAIHGYIYEQLAIAQN